LEIKLDAHMLARLATAKKLELAPSKLTPVFWNDAVPLNTTAGLKFGPASV